MVYLKNIEKQSGFINNSDCFLCWDKYRKNLLWRVEWFCYAN